MLPLTNTSLRRLLISGNWTRPAKHWNVFPRNRRSSFSVGSKGRPGCGLRIMRFGSKVSALQPESGVECDAAIIGVFARGGQSNAKLLIEGLRKAGLPE